MTHLAEVGTMATCWGVVVVVWVAGALYNLVHARRGRTLRQTDALAIVGTATACAILVVLGHSYATDLAVTASWVKVLGAAILVSSTVFTVWARFSLGTMWSVAPKVRGDQLRTRGPYAVTRHPIYSGLLGMLLGTTLLVGIGQVIVLVPVGLVLFEVKIRQEERLLLATFPEEYTRYRREVPQLIPGLRALRRRRSGGS
jgi:protein-S-isoprenylcysteine O-methyltransferase Ste14